VQGLRDEICSLSWQSRYSRAMALRKPVRGQEMIGRELELSQLERELDDGVPWITIHGAGGIGKSKLLAAFALELEARGDAELLAVSLASSTAGRGLAAIANVLGCDTRMERIAEALAAKPRAFLLIDNAETCILECATLLEFVLPRAPDLQVVLTSRVATGSLSEKIFRLGPLSVSGEEGKQAPAVRLALREMQRMGIEHAPELPSAIAHHTSGYPLAIMLAIGKLRVGIDPLQVRFGGANEGSDSRLPERQQSIARVLEDTCKSLPKHSQVLLALYAMFVALERTRAGYAEALLPMTPSELDRARQVLVEHALFEPETWTIPEFVRQWIRDGWKREAKELYRIAERAYAEGILSALQTTSFDALHRNDLEPSAEVLALEAEIAPTFEIISTVSPRFEESFLASALRGALALVFAKGLDLQGWTSKIEAVFPTDSLSSPDSRAFRLIGLGRLHRFQDDYARSLVVLSDALKEKLSPPLEAACKLQVAMTYCRTGAWENVFSALDTFPSTLTDVSLRAEAKRVRAWAFHLKGDREEALLAAQEAEAIYEQARVAPSWMSQAILAVSLRALGRSKEALLVYERVTPKLSATANRRAAAIFFSDYASFLIELKDFENALRAATQARTFFEAVSDFARADETQCKAALAKAHLGAFAEAAAELEILYARTERTWGEPKLGLRAFVGALRALLLKHLDKHDEARLLAVQSRSLDSAGSSYASATSGLCSFVLEEAQTLPSTERDGNAESASALSLLESIREGTLLAPSRPYLRTVPSGAEIRVDGDVFRVDLQSRVVLQRLLAVLIEAHAKGQKQSIEELIEQTWTGERMLRAAGRNRLRVAVRTLRELGLRSLILTTPTGYALADHLGVETG
jgi:tetratricopeptide (TPR) repeat protein